VFFLVSLGYSLIAWQLRKLQVFILLYSDIRTGRKSKQEF